MKAITINPADAASSHVRSGIVFSGHPFDCRTVAELVLVDGQVAYKRE